MDSEGRGGNRGSFIDRKVRVIAASCGPQANY